MWIGRRRFISLAAAAGPAVALRAWGQDKTGSASQDIPPAFPGAQWEKANPAKLGWSPQGLEEANRLFDSLPESSMVVVDRGLVIAAWGDAAKRVKLSSVRKTLLSALFGKPVSDGRIALDDTLERLGIDDDPPLTQNEKQATVRMLLESRSGVYHSYVGGTPEMREKMPAREAHLPGTFWYYNNWDFNALGGVYEKKLNTPIGKAFQTEIAAPIQMEDFSVADTYYVGAAPDAEAFAKSNYPAYHFRLSARDMARFGLLFLRHGSWNGTQLVPSEWVKQSTTSYSDTSGYGEGFGYGYLWWVRGYGLNVDCFSARGALGKYIIVIPQRDLVVAFVNHTEFPDNAQAMTRSELKKLPDVRAPDVGKLVALLLKAQSS
jgi:CubicO group peptidase (beta-lactamase class C family)